MNRRNFIKGSIGFVGLGLFSGIARTATEYDFDTIITDGMLLDGNGGQPYFGDIGIVGDRIQAIGNLKKFKAYRVLKADGLAVSPGFIDIHSHSEDELLVNPRAESKIRQGVTTEILGQDGNSIAPLSPDMQETLNYIYRDTFGIKVDWRDFYGYFKRLSQRGIAVNVGMMLGQGTLREFVVGREDRPASTAEIERMKELVQNALDNGALGVSSGLEYTPGAFASSVELIEICNVMHFSTGIYTTHMRNEADYVLEALDEAIAVARGADVSLHISHFKCMGERNWIKIEDAFDKIERARRKGVSITLDRYPYTAYNTSLSSLFPIWARSGTTEDFITRLRNPDELKKIKQDTLAKVEMLGSWYAVMINSVELERNKHLEGKRIPEIVGTNGWANDEFEFVRRLIIQENNSVGMCGFAMSERNTAKVLSHPLCMAASDASARADYGILARSHPHPRTYGTFPRVLGKYVRDQKVMTLSEAIRKMTSLPAGKLGLQNRGQIKPNYFADLVIFDPETIRDTATFTRPHQYPEGIHNVLVNGSVVVENNEHTGALAGRIIRGRQFQQNY